MGVAGGTGALLSRPAILAAPSGSSPSGVLSFYNCHCTLQQLYKHGYRRRNTQGPSSPSFKLRAAPVFHESHSKHGPRRHGQRSLTCASANPSAVATVACPCVAHPALPQQHAMSSETDSRWQTVYHSRRRSQDLATIVIRPSGIPLAKIKPTELIEITDSILQPRPQQNLIAVKIFHPSAQQTLLAIRSFLLASTEVPVTTYEAAPTDSCRGVIHGVPAGTSPQELLSHLISTGAPIIKARMMGSTETALLTFEGSFVPRYVLFYQADYRCHPERRKPQFCQRCHKIGHRKDVCTLPPSTELCQTCSEDLTKLPPGQEHDCYAPCRNCKGSHSSTWAECPEKLKADAKQITNHLLLRKHRTTTVPDPSLAIAIQTPRSESTINDKIRSTTRPGLPNAKTHRTQQQHRPRDIKP
ncbi:hypothetical protein HPB48_006089 [Haemaphysalis longicornis]|uniref:Uncharacterized protein n=1 Tax=Haemaphysalis longicornis TaxID=44386 RepID=A0A9J6F9D9_HAELO|nr:hypothetical protein HPB48_006089 [Haemaphysalis longicornis]